jgi:hypothetical protein
LILLLTGATARTAPDVAEKVAEEARQNIQIHDGFLADEKKDVQQEKQVKANKDMSALQRTTPKKENKAEEISTITKKLEGVITGLQKIQKTQGSGPEGETKFSKILTPFLAGLHTVIDEVKTDKKLSEDQKLEKLKNAQASIAGLTKDMAKRSLELKDEDESEKESLLLGVLMARKGHPESQMEVMKSDDFKNLACVKYVLEHHDAKKEVAEEVAVYLDGKSGGGKNNTKKAAVPEKKMSLQAVTAEIVGQLQGQLTKMQEHMKLQEKLHGEVDGEHKKILDKLNAEEKKLKTGLKGAADQKKKKQVDRAIRTAKRLQKKEDAEYKREHGMITRDVGNLKSAIESVKKGDMKALASAQSALEQSMNSMKNTQDFLHFLQLSTYTREQDCPYCKAQCLEKCHADGHSFMDCMGQCENAGN